MSPRIISYGKCFLCGKKIAKNVATRHLAKCLPLHEEASEKVVRLFHLRAEGAYAPIYWLDFEILATATLLDLDDFLRAIWLECCGHLSAFTIKNVRYELDTGMVDAMWKGFFGPYRPVRSMDSKLYQVLAPGDVFKHEYDFGTTTELKLKVIGERQGPLPKRSIRILARNYAPLIRCTECEQPAKWLSTSYQPYCEEHAQKHEEWMEGSFLPLVNSPRTGDCAYTGPENKSLRFEETVPA
ncbi:MAG: hypothetical protein ACK4VW_08830 [Anaerolineales bacterium]